MFRSAEALYLFSDRRHQCVTESRLASDYVLIWITGVSGLPGGLVWRTLGTSYLEYGAHLTEVLPGAQKPESQNWTHMFRDGIEMGNKTVGNLSDKHKTRCGI